MSPSTSVFPSHYHSTNAPHSSSYQQHKRTNPKPSKQQRSFGILRTLDIKMPPLLSSLSLSLSLSLSHLQSVKWHRPINALRFVITTQIKTPARANDRKQTKIGTRRTSGRHLINLEKVFHSFLQAATLLCTSQTSARWQHSSVQLNGCCTAHCNMARGRVHDNWKAFKDKFDVVLTVHRR